MNNFENHYGEALFQMALKQNEDQNLKKQMDELYKRYKSNENINEFLDSINEGLLASFDKVYSGFINEYDRAHHSLTINVVSAFPIEENEERMILNKLEALTGKKVELVCEVDSSLLGGIIIKFDKYEIDGSLKAKLNEIKKSIM